VELYFAVKVAIVAPNDDQKLFLHGTCLYQCIHSRIVSLQIVGRQHGFPTRWATQPVLLHAANKAVRVNGMPACRNVNGFNGVEQIFQADGAVGVELLGLAPVI
jgi:hypothetical protein